MEEEVLLKRKCKLDRSNIFSKLYSLWIFPLLVKGLRQEITPTDICRSPTNFDTKYLADKLEIFWKQELKRQKPSFFKTNARYLAKYLILIVLLNIVREAIFCTLLPFFLARLIKHFSVTSQVIGWNVFMDSFALIVCSIFHMLLQHPHSYLSMLLTVKTKVSWVTLIYRKALRLNNKSMADTTIGQIINMMTNDVCKIHDFMTLGCCIITTPLEIAIITWMCFNYFGNVAFINFAFLFILAPINFFLGLMHRRIQKKVSKYTDFRINLMSEAIKAMRVIKMYAWEKHFSEIISDARRKEMKQIRHTSLLNTINYCFGLVSTRFILFAILVTYVLLGNVLPSYKVFAMTAIFDSVSHNIMFFFPYSIVLLFEMINSCKRIQKFLMLEEVNDKTQDSNYFHSDILCKTPVYVDNVDVMWNKKQSQPSLSKLSLNIQQGELVVVVGSVGSGKSTFLMSLLNELSISSGSIDVNGKVSYAPQDCWSFNASIKQNILFGNKYDRAKFDQVIDVCEMKRDIELFPYRERTLVGERGMVLSGGQKARLTLARTIYCDADIYLLDDPLSAVDAKVANEIFDKCLMKYLKHKTVVLVTHQVQFARKASKILVLNNGEQVAFGTYEELVGANIDLELLVRENCKTNANNDSDGGVQTINKVTFSTDTTSYIPKIVDEKSHSGPISYRVYWTYIRAGAGSVMLFTILFSCVAFHFWNNYIALWLAEWTNKQDNNIMVDINNNILMYSLFILALFVSSFIRTFAFNLMFVFCSINLHQRIFNAFIRLPISFFDNNPEGRILNRFSKDMGVIDICLPDTAYDVSVVLSEILGAAIILLITKWTLMFPILGLVIAMIALRVMYLRTSRNLKRFLGTTRSTIFNHTNITLHGLVTIRAFNVQNLFLKHYYTYQNDHTDICIASSSSEMLLGVSMDILSLLNMIFVTGILLLFKDDINGGQAGVVLSVLFNMIGMIQWGVRQSAELENHMTSVESILDYSNLKSEAPLESSLILEPNWPSVGSICFDHVCLKYDSTMSDVLHDVCFTVKGGEKIGIVGRTGSGKSSLITALFRLVEIQGTIWIDDVDCSAIGLHQLRKKMSIIPQEPTAFNGTLRKNVDPFGEFTDDDIWIALDETQLKKFVSDLPGKLSYQLTESGGNLSVGQRQLICLARALLRKNQILILDEATANVDHKTDSLIQKTIRRNFEKCTVLTIAHRLNTIIDSDRVIVMDNGKVVQIDTPRNLLQDRTGIFYELAQQIGIVQF